MLGKAKRLSKEEQERLLLEYYNTKNPEIKEQLIESNIPLVIYFCKKYATSACFDRDDAVSVGTLGLIRAIDTFDPNKNIKFSVYAFRCITNRVKMEFRSLSKHKDNISLESSLTGSSTKDENLRLEKALKSDYDVIEKGEENYLYSIAKEKIESMPEREKMILINHFGLNGQPPKLDSEIAKELNLSRAYISRIKNWAIDELKTKFNESMEQEKEK